MKVAAEADHRGQRRPGAGPIGVLATGTAAIQGGRLRP
jgi:hypothetical protein